MGRYLNEFTVLNQEDAVGNHGTAVGVIQTGEE